MTPGLFCCGKPRTDITGVGGREYGIPPGEQGSFVKLNAYIGFENI